MTPRPAVDAPEGRPRRSTAAPRSRTARASGSRARPRGATCTRCARGPARCSPASARCAPTIRELTVRHVPCTRQPQRVVVDSHLDLPPGARILAGEPPLVLAVSDDAAQRRAPRGARRGSGRSSRARARKVDLAAVARAAGRARLQRGHRRDRRPGSMGSLLRAGVIDEIVLVPRAADPRRRGAGPVRAAASSRGSTRPLRPRIVDVRSVGADLRITARMER